MPSKPKYRAEKLSADGVRKRQAWTRPPEAIVLDSLTYDSLKHELHNKPVWEANACYLCTGHQVLSRYTALLHFQWMHIDILNGGPATPEDEAGIRKLVGAIRQEYGVDAPWPKGDPVICPACGGTGKGPQHLALTTLADEIFFGGEKGGGKTSAMTFWMVHGNPDQPQYDDQGRAIWHNQAYYHHPAYRGLVVRKNQEDLSGWLKYAIPFYQKLGAEYLKAEGTFEWASGAVIWTGHLADAKSYQKYMGKPELHRLAIEEITQLPEEELYEQMRSNVRTTHPELHPQIFNSANPIGPGKQWVADRFVRMKDENGNRIPRKTLATFFVPNPFTGKKMPRTRIFIPAGLRDNPHIDKGYLGVLAGLSPRLQKAYLQGDWESMEGQYFHTFRDPDAQNLAAYNEPENACHVIKRRKEPPFYPKLDHWWARQMGGDWGSEHEASYHWGCRDPYTSRLHVYREFVCSKTTAVSQGVRIAELSRDDLERLPDHSMTLWYSRDAFIQRSNDEGMTSLVELLARGIAMVLGPDAISVPGLQQLAASTQDYSWDDRPRFRQEFNEFQQSLAIQKSSGITIRMCNSNRVLGWNYIREGFEWLDPVAADGEYSQELELKISREFGMVEAERYRNRFNRQKVVRPWLQIWDTCPRLRAAIPRAQADDRNPEDVSKKHFTGADVIDSFRYLVVGFRDDPSPIPPEVQKMHAIDAFKATNPNHTFDDLVRFNEALERAEKATGGPLHYATLGRRATMAGRILKQAWGRRPQGSLQ